MSRTATKAIEIVSALDLLAKSALTVGQIVDLLTKENLTEADVKAQLDRTDEAIRRAREKL